MEPREIEQLRQQDAMRHNGQYNTSREREEINALIEHRRQPLLIGSGNEQFVRDVVAAQQRAA